MLRLVLDHCVRSGHGAISDAAQKLLLGLFRGEGATGQASGANGAANSDDGLLAAVQEAVGSRLAYCLEQATVVDMHREGIEKLINLYGKVAGLGSGRH